MLGQNKFIRMVLVSNSEFRRVDKPDKLQLKTKR